MKSEQDTGYLMLLRSYYFPLCGNGTMVNFTQRRGSVGGGIDGNRHKWCMLKIK